MDMADHLVQDGYRDLGYEYVNIDVRQCTSDLTFISLCVCLYTCEGLCVCVCVSTGLLGQLGEGQ